MSAIDSTPVEPGLRRKALTSFAGFAIPVLIALVAMPILYRRMGASSFGILSIALLSPTLSLSFDFGMSNAAVRRVADELEAQSPALGATLGGYAISLSAIGVVLASGIALAAPLLASLLGFAAVMGASAATSLLQLCALWVALSLITALPGVILRAQQRFGAITLVQTISTIALWLALLTLEAAGRPIFEMVAAGILIGVLTGVVTFMLARHRLPIGTRLAADLRVIAADARFSFGLSLVQLSNVLAFQLDRVIVSALASPAAAGTYALCVAVANKTLFAIASLTSFAYPAVAAMRSDGRSSEVAALLEVLQRVAAVLIASILVPALMLSAPFLALWLGAALPSGAVELLQLLWIGYAIAAIGAPATHVITGTGTSRLAAVFAWVTAFTLLGTMALLVPSYGLVGAGVANMTAMSTALIFLLLVRKQLKVASAAEPARFWLGLLIGASAQAMVLIAVVAHVNDWERFMLAGVVSLLVFFIARALTRTTTGEERRLIQSLAVRLSVFR